MSDSLTRLTTTRIAVLEQLLAVSDSQPLWGMELAYRTNLEPSTVSNILKDLREMGWIESWIDEDNPRGGGRARRYHELTPVGYKETMRALLARTERRGKQFRNYG